MIFRATAIGDIAKEILENRKTFYVHSIFKKGFNIVNDAQELIFIGTDENGMFPFGILVDQQTKHSLLNEIKLNQQLTIGPNTIHISKTCQLVWHVASLPFKDLVDSVNTDNLKANLSTYDFTMYDDGDFDRQTMSRIMYALEYEDVETIEQYYRYLIGRGEGLTPSGDDILTGMLFIHFTNPYIRKPNLEKLKQLLNESLTTLVGETFLKCAQKGLFSSKISKLQHEPSLENIDRLLKVGLSSGRDTVYGMFVALT